MEVSDWRQAPTVLPTEKHLFFHRFKGRLGGPKQNLDILETWRNWTPSGNRPASPRAGVPQYTEYVIRTLNILIHLYKKYSMWALRNQI